MSRHAMIEGFIGRASQHLTSSFRENSCGIFQTVDMRVAVELWMQSNKVAERVWEPEIMEMRCRPVMGLPDTQVMVCRQEGTTNTPVRYALNGTILVKLIRDVPDMRTQQF